MRKSVIPFLALLVIASCSKKELPAPSVQEGQGAITIMAKPAAKTVLEGPVDDVFSVKWTAGDVLGVWSTSNGETTFVQSSPLAEGAEVAQFPVSLPAVEQSLTAVYPATSVGIDGDVVIVTIPDTQTSANGSFDPQADLLVATAEAVAAGTETVNMCFHRPGSIIRFEVQGLDSDETLSSLEITSDGTVLAGSYSFNSVTGEVEIRTEGSKTLTINANSNVAAARVFAGTLESMSIKVTTNKASYLKAVSTKFSLKSDHVECFTIFITPGEKMEGDGTAGNPYIIASEGNLLAVSSLLKEGTPTYFKLACDIDLSDIGNWDPINPTAKNMRIDFDGQNHTISNMTTSGKQYGSFFGLLAGDVRNLKFDNCTSTAVAGGVAGIASGWCGISDGSFTGSYTNCHVTNSTVKTDNSSSSPVIGGFTGKAGAATITNCSFSGSVTCTSTGTASHVGGFVGEVHSGCVFDTNSVKADVSSVAVYVGGFCGYHNKGSFNNCSVEGNITAGKSSSGYSYCGGIIGYSAGTANPTITNCSYKGCIESSGKVTAGIIGQVSCDTGTTTITGCSVEGSIHGSQFIAGVLSYNQKGTLVMSGCTCTATISCDTDTCGGMVCYTANSSSSTITDCHVACNITSGKNNKNNSYCGGIMGQLNAHTTTIERCSYSGALKASGAYAGGILGMANGSGGTAIAYIRNCSATGSVKGTSQCGGISGDIGKNSEITNCYAGNTVEGNSYGLGGILSRNCNNINPITGGSMTIAVNFNTPVTGCIAWNPSVKCTKSGGINVDSQYSSGAVVGFSTTLNTLANCWRRPDMVFQFHTDANKDLDTLFDHNDADASHPLTENASKTYYYPYHGKAAASGETASQVAARIGWDTAIWDFTGSEPKLK